MPENPEDFTEELQNMLRELQAEAMEAMAEAERQKIRDEVKDRIDGRTPDEIAEEALFEALVSQRAIQSLVEAFNDMRKANKEYADYLHSHIHSHDRLTALKMLVVVAEIVARLTGEKEVTYEEIQTFLEATISDEDETTITTEQEPILIADALVDFFRERREGTSRFQA
jgi:VIT1/CCC1 family predicted Fe2+/Mn2+ transporter